MPLLHTRFTPSSALLGGLRVSLYLGALAVAFTLWSVRAVYADAELALRDITEGLAAELGPELIAEPQRFSINGQVLLFSARQSKLSVAEVLARFEAECRADSEPHGFTLPQGPGRADSFVRELLAFTDKLLVLRSEQAGEGRLLCFAPPRGRGGLAGMVAGVKEFAATGDLARIGHLRHVTARAREDGSTEVHALWTDGKLELGALFPVSGDAPGEDPRDVPRPDSARRIGSAHAEGRSFGLHVYESPDGAQQLLSFYERALPAQGWQRLPPLAADGPRAEVITRAFTREGRAIALGLRAAPGERSVISLVELGSVQRNRAEARAASF